MTEARELIAAVEKRAALYEEAERKGNRIYGDNVAGDIRAVASYITAAVQAETERCAKVAETYEDWCKNWGHLNNEIAARSAAKEVAAAIRGQG